jgi:hypothetical protein
METAHPKALQQNMELPNLSDQPLRFEIAQALVLLQGVATVVIDMML